MKQKTTLFIIRILISIALQLDGWKKCNLNGGRKGFEKLRKSPSGAKMKLRGDLTFALSKALGGF